jgi:hypothetical protein
MSWGNKLVIVFIAFVGLIATLVYRSVTTKFDLVTKDYYKDELRYQDKIDGAANAVAAGNIQLKQDAATLVIQLPASLQDKIAEGDAWFYCKTNAAKDIRVPVKIEGGFYSIDRSVFAKDSYELKLQLTAEGKKYYYLQPIIIQ